MKAARGIVALLKSRTSIGIVSLLGIAILSISRILADAPGISSSGTFGGAIALAAPVAMAGLAGLISERAGVVNIGLQGMMVLGTWGAGYCGWQFGPWGALVGGALFGAMGGALHALNTVYFGVDHAISGVAINLLAPGIARFMSGLVFVGRDGGTLTDSPPVGNLGKFTMPLLAGGRLGTLHTPDLLGAIERSGWFLFADIAGLLGGLFRSIAVETAILLGIIPLVSYVIWRTPYGLRLRASGEKPSAAESLGVNVVLIRWSALIASGFLAGLGGAWLVTNVGKYQQGQEGLRGFLGLAAVIFGNWKPMGVLVGSVLFQFTESVRLQIGDRPSLAFVLAIGIAALAVAIYRSLGRSWKGSAGFFVVSLLIFVYFNTVDRVDDKLSATFPYVITLLVLVFSSRRLRPPSSVGLPWSRGRED